MKALILAAGFGSRLRPLTNKIPKALVKYKGRELIDYQISVLVSLEITEITVVVGYQAQILKDFLEKKYSSLQIKIIENKEFSSSNSAFSACKAIQESDLEEHLHINCDILFSKKILSKIIHSDESNILAVRKDLQFNDSMENVISIGDRIVNMSTRNTPLSSYKAFGLAKISSQALAVNLKKHEDLSEIKQRKENYFGLIRMALGEIDYKLIEGDKFNLAEINSLEDLGTNVFKL